MRRFLSEHNFGLLPMFLLLEIITVLGNTVVSAFTVWLMIRGGILAIAQDFTFDGGRLILSQALISVPIGVLISLVVVSFPLRPVRELIDGMNRLASGDFKTRMNLGVIMKRYSPFVSVAKSFNTMAEQLESTQMLRSDFVDNFSHEFKTPIVSIAGFAKLLRRGSLPKGEQQEALRIIEEESMRLSAMATNILNLTKVENQTILTDVTRFNLSEQMRSCILLLENKWEQKHLELQLDFGEYEIEANQELLKQVWINLLDNAVKFAPEEHTVRIQIQQQGQQIQVTIANTGSQIPAQKLKKVFDKFYQADESHTTQGNGVGLAIVKRVVELHHGSVCVSSERDVTEFVVTLPEKIC